MNNIRQQREIPLIQSQEEPTNINPYVSKGYRFEMEVLGAFKASSIYQQDPNIRMVSGDKGFCDGILYYAPKKENHQINLDRKILEIEVKLRNGIGRQDRDVLIDVLKEKSVNSFLKFATTNYPNNYNRILVLGMIKDLSSQNQSGLPSYDLYGSIAVVFFQKIRTGASEFAFNQVIRFYSSFHEFNRDLYLSMNCDGYFDRLSGSLTTKKYFQMMKSGRLKELSFLILEAIEDLTPIQEQIFRKLLSHQIKLNINRSFSSLKGITGNPNASTHMTKLVERGWIIKNSRQYRIDFNKIIEDLFNKGSSVDSKAILRQSGFEV